LNISKQTAWILSFIVIFNYAENTHMPSLFAYESTQIVLVRSQINLSSRPCENRFNSQRICL